MVRNAKRMSRLIFESSHPSETFTEDESDPLNENILIIYNAVLNIVKKRIDNRKLKITVKNIMELIGKYLSIKSMILNMDLSWLTFDQFNEYYFSEEQLHF